MKTKLSFLSFILLVCTLGAQAQRDNKPWSIGFGIEGGTLAGNARSFYDFNFGITARFSYQLGPGWATFTTGSAFLIPKNLEQNDNPSIGVQIPFKLGYKYKIVGPLFVMGEAGYSVYQYYYQDDNDNVLHTNNGGFTYAPSIGVTTGVFEAAIKYESMLVNGGNISHANLRLGFNF